MSDTSFRCSRTHYSILTLSCLDTLVAIREDGFSVRLGTEGMASSSAGRWPPRTQVAGKSLVQVHSL